MSFRFFNQFWDGSWIWAGDVNEIPGKDMNCKPSFSWSTSLLGGSILIACCHLNLGGFPWIDRFCWRLTSWNSHPQNETFLFQFGKWFYFFQKAVGTWIRFRTLKYILDHFRVDRILFPCFVPGKYPGYQTGIASQSDDKTATCATCAKKEFGELVGKRATSELDCEDSDCRWEDEYCSTGSYPRATYTFVWFVPQAGVKAISVPIHLMLTHTNCSL